MNAQTTLTCILIVYSIWSFFWICFNLSKFILVSAERDLLAKQLQLCKLDLAICSHENELQHPSKTEKVQTIMNNNQQPLEDQLAATETTFSCSGQELLEANNEITQAFADEINQELAELRSYPSLNVLPVGSKNYTVVQLKALAKEKGIKGFARMNKQQLMSAVL